jgi:hypothetical protein
MVHNIAIDGFTIDTVCYIQHKPYLMVVHPTNPKYVISVCFHKQNKGGNNLLTKWDAPPSKVGYPFNIPN